MAEQTLISTYNKWVTNPALYGEQMLSIIDKLIYNIIHKQGRTVYTIWGLEDKDDVIQDIRILLYNKLKEVKNPTNKRLYCFLTSHIRWALAIKRRNLKKKIINEAKMEKPKEGMNPSYLFLNGDETMYNIADLLIQGHSAKDVKASLGISNTVYKRYVEKIKGQLR